MTKRERVERTMALHETDRVAVYDLLRCDAALEHFSGQKLPPLCDEPQTQAQLRRIVGRAVGEMLDMTRSVGFGPVVTTEGTDDLGLVWRTDPYGKTMWIASRPFNNEAGAVEFSEKYLDFCLRRRKAVEADPGSYRDEHRRQFLEIQATIGDTVNLLAKSGTGMGDIRVRLGMELFAYVDADQAGLIGEIMEETTRYRIALCHAIADRELSPCTLTYGDIACKNMLLHSPAWLRREFFPRLKRLNDAWHEHGIRCLFHSDGQLMEVMDDLIDTGIDGLNPIETLAGMDLAEVKAKYGHKIFLAGGIDMSQLLSLGEPEQVREVCRQAMRTAYPGYFIGSTTELNNSCRLENVIAMFEASREYTPCSFLKEAQVDLSRMGGQTDARR